MNIKPLVNQLGAVITDIDITTPLSFDQKIQLQQALVKYHLLLFRGKTLTAEQQISFSKTFGELERFPWRPSQLQQHPEIFRLANHPEDGYENVGMYWHSDGTFNQDPTPISIFHLLAVPEEGGDTWFTNLRKTWESLPDSFKQKIKRINTIHGNGVIHPLVKAHPVSGKQHVYLNVGLTAALAKAGERGGDRIGDLESVDDVAAENIITTIDDAFSLPENSYHHKWLPGDLIVADNFGVAHQARPVGKDTKRILHRTTVSAKGVWWRSHQLPNVL